MEKKYVCKQRNQKIFINFSQYFGRTKDIIVRAGVGAGTTLADGGTSANLLTEGQYIVKYKGPAQVKEVFYLTFPTPMVADFFILQWEGINHNVQLAELRIIKCSFV